MKINIYYGGRGIIGDPSLYVINKMTKVFEELNVSIARYDLFDIKNAIATLPQTIKDADGIILASTVEWHGVGGYIYNFLDACWLYGDKEKIKNIYMAPVVMSTTYGEKDAELDLSKAWITLGGMVADGIAGYIPDVAELESSKAYNKVIENCAENIYRAISQKRITLPISTREVGQIVSKTRPVYLTQQETEQLSEYISDENYVEKQKKDIKDLASLFKGKMVGMPEDNMDKIQAAFRNCFNPKAGVSAKYKILISDSNRSISLKVEKTILEIKEADVAYPDATLTLSEKVLLEVIEGRKTIQGGFMDGSILVKGDFQNLRLLDEVFPFMK